MKITLNDLFKDRNWKLYYIATPKHSCLSHRGNSRLDKMQFETYICEDFSAPMECRVTLTETKDKLYSIKTYYFDNATKLELYFPTSFKMFQDNVDLLYRD